VYEIPNAFTPNGDGINDVFNYYTHFILSGRSNFEIQIFNRWGSLMYKSNDISATWDGKYNGDYVPTGIYLYNIKFTDGTKKNNYVSGTIHVLR